MSSPRDLDLPHDEWRPHQWEAVQAAQQAIDMDKPKVLLSAPTGSGKTLIGAALARMMGARALYLSQTIHLQNQYLRTLPGARTATGRANHECRLEGPFGQRFAADEAPCPCPNAHSEGCSYYRQWFECLDAQDAVLNYAYAVRVLKAEGLRVYLPDRADYDVLENPFGGRELLVCDEGHLLEKAIIDADTIEIYESTFKRLGVDIPHTDDLETWREWAGRVLPWLNGRNKEVNATLRAMQTVSDSERGYARKVRSAQMAVSALSTISGPYFVGPARHGYTIRPLWAWDRAQKTLFRHGANALIMSATLGNPHLTARLLGIGMDELAFIEVPSTFPLANRPVYYWPVAKMNYQMPDVDKFRQVQALVKLARMFPNSAGVVHCASFALGAFLYEGFVRIDPENARRVVLHRSGNKSMAAAFESIGGNAILISPSVTMGVDWDFVTWQMIPKVPFADLSDTFTRLRADYQTEEGEPIGRKVYQQDAALSIVQASGRCVRTPESKGVTIITDQAFWPLFKHIAPSSFPDWFRSAVRWEDVGGLHD